MDALSYVGPVYIALVTIAVLALVYRIVEGPEAWAALVAAFKAWPSETWANITDYLWTRPRNRMEVDTSEWGYTSARATRAADARIEARARDHVQEALDPARVAIRDRINARAQAFYDRRKAKVLPMAARKQR